MFFVRLRVALSLLVVLLVAPACGDDGGDPPVEGALVEITANSEVGVLLEDFPPSMRTRLADELAALPAEWWIERARWQLRMTSIRLVYRKYYFPEAEWPTHDALPLPPEQRWNITLGGTPTRTNVGGHDYVSVPYTFRGVIVTDAASPGLSEPNLAQVGGVWDEPFVFPVDPTLLLQRTGYACISEDEFPPESVDAEEAYRFYDDTCEEELPGAQGCHFTEPLPTESCVEALDRAVGRIDVQLHYARIAWDPAVADAERFGPITTPDAPDLEVLTTGEGLNDNRVIYKYIPDGHCSVVENCVGGSGWRRLLVFDSHDHNVGGKPIHIGEVDYFNQGLGGELIDHNVYTYSDCHEHYHFEYYGDFSFASGLLPIQKNGFCLESTDRLSNHESSPLQAVYTCEFQGVQAGWGDLYASSLTCNWIDITDLDVSGGAVTGDLTFHSNPDGFICEGTLVVDAQGNQMWEPSGFMTPDGKSVDRPVCEQTPGTEENDVGTIEVTVPPRGAFVTQPCTPLREHDLGPLRNCGFTMDPQVATCTPGARVDLTCSGGDAARPQVVRVCEASAVLGTGMDCTFTDALAGGIVEGDPAVVSFTCPGMRDPMEPGGRYAVYAAPVWEPDGAVAITCAP